MPPCTFGLVRCCKQYLCCGKITLCSCLRKQSVCNQQHMDIAFFATSVLISSRGPPMCTMQGGIAGMTASKHTRIACGFPGKFTTSVLFLITATCLERIAVGTVFAETDRIRSPKPGSSRVATASVASGVTSLGVGPVPPVVTTRQQF